MSSGFIGSIAVWLVVFNFPVVILAGALLLALGAILEWCGALAKRHPWIGPAAAASMYVLPLLYLGIGFGVRAALTAVGY